MTDNLKKINITILNAAHSIENCTLKDINDYLIDNGITIHKSNLNAHINFLRKYQVLKSNKVGKTLTYRLSELPFEASVEEAIIYLTAQEELTETQLWNKVNLLIGYTTFSKVVEEADKLVHISDSSLKYKFKNVIKNNKQSAVKVYFFDS